jgi:hypothetical protein
MIDYKEAKSSILSRKELNRMITSLKNFNKEGAEDLVVTKRWIYAIKVGV